MLQRKQRELNNFVSVIFIGWSLFILSGCATTHFTKMSPDFKNKTINVKTIGFLVPMDYESNRTEKNNAFQAAIVDSLQNNSHYQVKLIQQEGFPTQWDSSIERVVFHSNEMLKDIELEKLWKDKKNEIISRKFFDGIKVFKALDPTLDALLLLKCNQHYGNAWASGLYAFGALGGIIAAASADKDPVIGCHDPANTDTYSSAVLVDLSTSDVLWYNFALRYGLNVVKEKDAKTMTKDTLYGLVNN